jgi:assimilatory nitrate reductase catalytic subunit
MTRTGRVPRLLAHASEPLAALAPVDAARLGIAGGGLVRVESAGGALVLRAEIDPGQRPGEIFVPMHWTDEFCSSGPVGRLVDGVVDPISGQPELKATPVGVALLAIRWRGLLLHRRAVGPEEDCHWSRIPLARGHAIELTGTEPLPGGTEFTDLVGRLLGPSEGAERLEMVDIGRGAWRFASLVGGRLESCLFLAVGDSAALPPREALAPLLGDLIAEERRPSLLAARSGAGVVAAGRTVCACFSVGLSTLRRTILDRRLTSVGEIGEALRAGTNCGTCIPELREILRDVHSPAA